MQLNSPRFLPFAKLIKADKSKLALKRQLPAKAVSFAQDLTGDSPFPAFAEQIAGSHQSKLSLKLALRASFLRKPLGFAQDLKKLSSKL